MKAIDLSGVRFGRLVAKRFDGHRGKDRLWSCSCDCGTISLVTAHALRSGNTSSCGCLRLERVTKLGLSGGPEYGAWKAARNRCHNPNARGFPNYGARGIRMCEEWRKGFAAFYRDMGPRPSPEHSLDRVDNDGPYAPENCRWATRREQSVNRRGNRRVTLDGRTLTVTEWGEESGVPAHAIANRIAYGWSAEEAIALPVSRFANRHDSRKITFRGETLTVPAWARRLGIHRTSLRERLSRMSVERALTLEARRGRRPSSSE